MQHWTLKRQDNNATLSLHPQYWWADEYDWTPLAQSSPRYTLGGAMDIQQGIKRAGRPITLDCTHARIKRGIVKQVLDWATVPELTMTLTHPDGRTFDVIFARPAVSDIRAIKPIRPEDESNDDAMIANINLITV